MEDKFVLRNNLLFWKITNFVLGLISWFQNRFLKVLPNGKAWKIFTTVFLGGLVWLIGIGLGFLAGYLF
ncbi:MAG: hypothetical protein JXA19_04355 [Anaerolineales bacterium]|nr:hypothetical protein [Anaerolineales bacterium]